MASSPSPAFDPIAWYAAERPEESAPRKLHLHGTFGPLDAYRAIAVRRQLNSQVELGTPVPADHFILSLGEAASRSDTKIGGVPYLSKHREWPRGEHGGPLPFLAQFNLSDSRDLVGPTASRLILIFADLRLHGGIVCLEGQALAPHELVSAEDIPVPSTVPAFTAARWRTQCFPEWAPRNGADASDIMRGEEGQLVYNAFFAFELMGMQIGRAPFLPSGSTFPRRDESIICSIAGIVPSLDSPFPFLNMPAPLNEKSAMPFIVPLSRMEDCDGVGMIFVLQDEDGRLRCVSRNL